VSSVDSAVLTLGDDREVHFKRQERKDNAWVNDASTLPFLMEHGALFLLHPRDEEPTPTKQNTVRRYQHGNVEVPHAHKLSVALALRTVTSKEQVHK
jgi:hypothetical protein